MALSVPLARSGLSAVWCHCSTFFSSFFSNRFFIAFSSVFRAFLASFSAPETDQKTMFFFNRFLEGFCIDFVPFFVHFFSSHFCKSRALVCTGARFLQFRSVVFWRAFSTLYLSKLVQKSIENRSKFDKK